MKRILCVLLFVFGLLTSAWADSSRYASESVLNSGKWVKIQVAEDGIYKLTAADLKKMGFSNLDKVEVNDSPYSSRPELFTDTNSSSCKT